MATTCHWDEVARALDNYGQCVRGRAEAIDLDYDSVPCCVLHTGMGGKDKGSTSPYAKTLHFVCVGPGQPNLPKMLLLHLLPSQLDQMHVCEHTQLTHDVCLTELAFCMNRGAIIVVLQVAYALVVQRVGITQQKI